MDPMDPSHADLSAAFEPFHHQQDDSQSQQQQQQQQQHQRFFPHLSQTTWPLLDDSAQAVDMSQQQQQQQQQSQQPSQTQHQHGNNDTSDSRRHNGDGTSAMSPRALTIATTNPPYGLDYMNLATANAGWQFQMPAAAHPTFAQDGTSMGQAYDASFGGTLHSSPVDFMSTSQAQLNNTMQNSLAMDPSTFWPASTAMDQPINMMAFASMNGDFNTPFDSFPASTTAGSGAPSSIPSNSPPEQWIDCSSSSGRSDQGWTVVNLSQSQGSFEFTAVVSPQALHLRTDSSSSDHSEVPLSAHSYGSYEEIFPTSPEPESSDAKQLPSSFNGQNDYRGIPIHPHINTNFSQAVTIAPSSSSSSTSPASSGAASPSSKRRKSPTGISPKVIGKKKAASGSAKDKASTERKVGRRRGPLRPDQRQQAHEIRKVGACLRCKYLKKTCDKGDPCGGCQPSHHRLWQVPCTRIDIKDIGYFFKDWSADYERHVTLGFTVANIKGFSQVERRLMVSHGYGFEFPIMAREVYVRDDKCFGLDWVETLQPRPTAFEVSTNKLSTGISGVSTLVVSEYLDRYLDYGFERFVDEYFEGTPFLTEILKTAHRFWVKTQLPVIRKGLKLVVAYALTLHITMVSGLSEEEMQVGRINDATSRWYGATCAPVMINFEIKKAMAEMWRELMKDILEELSALYSSVYSGEKLRHWPTIFILASLLLAVWELMQFDCHYRVPDEAAVNKFCNDMESTPVGVIVGLFQAISTKLPSFMEWDTRKHAQMLNSNQAVCDAMTEVRSHVLHYEQYLKSRSDASYDRNDFDSLSNKFLSKLVIRAGAS